MRPGAAGAELSGGRVRGPGAGPESAGGCGPACLAPSLRLSRTGSPPPPPRVRGKEGRGSRVESSKGGEGGWKRSWGMGDGLEGRRLTGLLTVKRENFPGMRELGGGRFGGRCWSRGRERKSAWGAGCSGEGCRTRPSDGRTQEGSPLTGPASALHAPFSAFPRGKEEALGLRSRSPATPPLQARVRGRAAKGRLDSKRNLLDGLRSSARTCKRAVELRLQTCKRLGGQISLQPGLACPRVRV